jgi:hypothetical protein
MGNIIFSIYFFKLLSTLGYIGLALLIYKRTKNIQQVVFFALNPLVILETLVNGHNDAFMMCLAIAGLMALHEKSITKYITGPVLLAASILVKGATVVALPVIMLFHSLSFEKQIKWIGVALFGVFLISPLREEMYPWYAIWWIACVAFVPIKHKSFLHTATYWLSFGLMLRYIPWIATREYGGTGPMIRTIVTWMPVVTYSVYRAIDMVIKKK